MKAIVLTRYGSPDVLRLQEVAKPEPAADEVLVKIRATAVNDWDWCFVRGKPYAYRVMFGLLRPKVAVLGAEVAGTVEAVGHGVTKLQPGDPVYFKNQRQIRPDRCSEAEQESRLRERPIREERAQVCHRWAL